MARSIRKRADAASRRKERETLLGIFLILFVIAVVLAVGFVFWRVTSDRKALDDMTLCPPDPVSLTVLLVDVTDPMTIPQRQDFMNQLAKMKNSIPRYGKLVVVKVDSTEANLLEPVIVRCNPGTAADVSDTTGNPVALQRRWQTEFEEPLQTAFEQLTRASGADQSPILESVQSVALTEFQRPGMEGKPRRLILASDLLQHTKEISLYRSLPSAEKLLSSTAFRRVRTDLKGIDVELWMLERGDAAVTQPRALAELWDQMLSAQGANVLRVYNVSG